MATSNRIAQAMTERIQKLLARAGVASRREADRWLEAGRVTVNGRTAAPGEKAASTDTLAVDGQPVSQAQEVGGTRVLLLHKAPGTVTTRSDPQGRPTVFDPLPAPPQGRWIQVGRLDMPTTGLLLFTTDGDLANALMHPSRELEREYEARIEGTPEAATLRRLTTGIELEDGPARFLRAEVAGRAGGFTILRVVLAEGRKREVRRLLEAVGHPVRALTRVRFGPIALPPDLAEGEWRELPAGEVSALRQAAGLGAVE